MPEDDGVKRPFITQPIMSAAAVKEELQRCQTICGTHATHRRVRALHTSQAAQKCGNPAIYIGLSQFERLPRTF
jgi:hypothetical protein